MVGENEEDDDEAQNEEAESPPRCLPGFAVGAIASTILLCGGGDGSIINPEPANASFVYYPTTNNATNPFELRMEKKTYMREETPKKLSEMNRMDRTTNTKNERKATPLPLRLSANKEEDFELDERYDIGVPSSSFNANTTKQLLPSLRKEDVFRANALGFVAMVVYFLRRVRGQRWENERFESYEKARIRWKSAEGFD